MDDLDLDRHIPIGRDDETDDVDLSGAISGIGGAGRRKVIRSEPATQISEFSINSDTEKVKLHELMGTLESCTATGDLKKQLRNVHKRQKVLAAPLSRFEQGALSRAAAYEQTAKEVSKWEPIVEKHKKAEQLEFPLEKPSLKVHTGNEFTKKIQPYTPLEKEIAILLHGSDNVLPEKSGLTKAEQRALLAMDIHEARRRRADLQKYRALLSYKESRAKRQKKIKSKQFHRILNKERKKEEVKTLDQLEEKDPELLKSKIQKAEKSRIQERMSLKHHGGSKKMKTKMIYAKYDKDARLQIDDMLQTSKELRQKVTVDSDSEEEVVAEPVVVTDEPKRFSPWTGSSLSGQKNPWLKATKDPVKSSPYTRPEAVVANEDDVTEVANEDDVTEVANEDDVTEPVEEDDDVTEDVGDVPRRTSLGSTTEVFVIGEPRENDEETSAKVTKKSVRKELKKAKVAKNLDAESNDEENEERNEIDDIFDTVNNKRSKSKRKKNGEKTNSKTRTAKKSKLSEVADVEVKKKVVRKKPSRKRKAEDVDVADDVAVDDSGLTISTERKQTLEDMDLLATQPAGDAVVTGLKKRARTSSKFDPRTNIYAEPKIDPGNFLTVPVRELRSSEAPLVAEGENGDDDVTQFDLIAEAFADDDVMDTFSKEKSAIEDRDKPKAIDLSLPGWGSWGGKDIRISRQKKRRFRIKPPPSAPRQDQNLKNVIISETKDDAVAKHQVSWLPGNFKNVHQFESSVRAPIGRTWNPETSFRDLTKPKVVTHLGTIINPMDESQKFQKQKTKGGPQGTKWKKGKKGKK